MTQPRQRLACWIVIVFGVVVTAANLGARAAFPSSWGGGTNIGGGILLLVGIAIVVAGVCFLLSGVIRDRNAAKAGTERNNE